MSETKFTPGPWIESGPSYGKGSMQKVSSVIPENDPDDEFDDICFFPEYVDDEINRANARLIAAAPDMYEALKCGDTLGNSGAILLRTAADILKSIAPNCSAELIRKADAEEAAIAKAEGRND